MTPLARFATPVPTVCAACRRRAWSLGYTPRASSPILWLCDDKDCLSLGKALYSMSQEQLDLYEIAARNLAGQEAGAYLDSIGKTDLATMSEDQWFQFLTTIVKGMEHHLRAKLLSGEAPF